MKKFWLAAALIASSHVHAAIDGIYSCIANVKGVQSQAYIAINSRDAQSVFTITTLSSVSDFYGYGVGTVNGATFTGSTQFLRPFSFSLGESGLNGTVEMLYASGATSVGVGCQKIW